MRFALLGVDPDALELARAVVRSGEHSLVWAGELGELTPLVESLAPAARVAEAWEGLLAGTAADAVIVARATDDDQRAEQLRKLVQERIPLLVSHPVVQSMLVCYELEMIRQGGGVLLPYVPGLGHPALARLRELLRPGGDGPVEPALGRIEQLAIERTLGDRSRPNVLRHFVRDMELVGPLCERLTKVGAMVPTAAAPVATDLSNLSVQMSGPEGALVRWSVVGLEDRAAATFTWAGSRGKATLTIAGGDDWKLDVRTDGHVSCETFPPWESAAWALSEFCAAVAGRPPALDWIGGCRTMELADAIDHSLERGRTIELHYEEPSEQSTFKGMMSGLGCFLLMGGLILLVAATMAVHLGIPLADYWPYLLLALLGTFLLLQLLRPPREV